MRKLQEYTEKEKKYMIMAARESIQKYFDKKKMAVPKNCPEKLKQPGACFVTLEKVANNQRELRGCVGTLYADRPLIKDIIENARNAAFEDSRFPKLAQKELKDIEIEISILTKPEELKFSDEKDLLKKLNPPEDGVILVKGSKRSTFLPVVWEHFQKGKSYDKELFLENLSIKAYLEPDGWRKGCKVYIYKTVFIKEDGLK